MTTQETYDKALAFTLQKGVEGGYTVDNGGPTNHGVTQREYDSWRTGKNLPTQDVREITHDEVVALYHDDYWNESKCDDLTAIDPKLAIAVFDTSVNESPGRAIKTLQKIVCPEEIDGICGPGTLGMTRKLTTIESKDVVGPYLLERDAYYDRLAVQDRKFAASLHGWHNRVNNLRKYLATW